jgi:hypothetical protein
MKQRQAAQAPDDIAQLVIGCADAGGDFVFGIDGVGFRGADAGVTDAGGMRQQVADGDFALGRHGGVGGVQPVVSVNDVGFGKLRDVLGNRVVQQKTAFFVQHHHGHTGNGFGL